MWKAVTKFLLLKINSKKENKLKIIISITWIKVLTQVWKDEVTGSHVGPLKIYYPLYSVNNTHVIINIRN